MHDFTGTAVFISGAAQGQGLSHAQAFARAGAKVALGDIDLDAATAAAAGLIEEGHTAVAVALDVRKSSSWREAIAQAETELGPIGVLVNNAGVGSWADVEEEDEQTWDRVIAINQSGVFHGMQAAIPSIRRAGGGAIVNIAAGMAVKASASCIAYHASKAAVLMLTKSAGLTLGRQGIRVNAVLPGPVDTGFISTNSADEVSRFSAGNPLGRIAQPDEISQAVLFLASPQASYVNATGVAVDGGLTSGAAIRIASRPE